MRFQGIYLKCTNAENESADNEWNPSRDECRAWEDKCVPTILESPNFDVIRETDDLYIALRDQDYSKLIKILTSMNTDQRLEIIPIYEKRYGQKFISRLYSKLSRGNFRNLVLALTQPIANFYASELKKAIFDFFTKYSTLVEIMGTLTNKGMKTVLHTYENENHVKNRSLVNDLKHLTCACLTSKEFQDFLTDLALSIRTEGAEILEYEIADQVYRLKKAESKWGTDYLVFNNFLLYYTNPHLRQLFKEFQNSVGYTLEETLAIGQNDQFRQSLIALYQIINDRSEFFAGKLHQSMNKWFFFQLDYETVTRIIVSRAEVDMGNIKSAYERTYNQTLASLIKSKTSGPYEEALLRLIGEPITTETNTSDSRNPWRLRSFRDNDFFNTRRFPL